MPKLKDQALERNQIRIEDAALQVFTRQGYHGTSVREIAEAAGVSLGNIYNYYATKEEIFESLILRYGKKMAALQAQRLVPLIGSLEPENLRALARFVHETVAQNSDFWRLMYIDVVEFSNKHFQHIFHNFPATLKAMRPGAFDAYGDRAEDAAFGFAGIYLQFVQYYLVETLFAGREHMGVPEEVAVEHFISVFSAGISSLGVTRAGAELGPEAQSGRNASSNSGGSDVQTKTAPGTRVRGAIAGARKSR